eukprot:425742_1
MTENDQKLLIEMLSNNVDNIGNIKQFLSLERKTFIKLIHTHTKIKTSYSAKIYKSLSNKLKQIAQTQQYGEFLCKLNSQMIDKDYHHILKFHVNNGNKITIENVFRFFGKVVHYNDTPTEKKECRSIKRREKRANFVPLKDDEKDEQNTHKDMWSLRQYYMQTTMDVIHSYLVHSDYKGFIERYANQNEEKFDEKLKISDADLSIANNKQKKSKYVTDSSLSNTVNYKFGVDHSHPHLSPAFLCLRDELLCNKFCKLTP